MIGKQLSEKSIGMIKNQSVKLSLLCTTLTFTHVHAATLPSSVDATRIAPVLPPINAPHAATDLTQTTQNLALFTPIPKEASHTFMHLKSIKFSGSTVFSNKELEVLYSDIQGKYIPLSRIYLIADNITRKYQEQGYFLSRAYIPEQTITNGTIDITISEGYIGKIKLDDAIKANPLAREIVDNLRKIKPVRTTDIEQALLQLNNLPSFKASGVLYRVDHASDGAVGMEFSSSYNNSPSISLYSNNYGSKYIGPYQNTFVYNQSFVHNQQTQFAILQTIPFKEMHFGSIEHFIKLPNDTSLSLYFNNTNLKPGDSLKRQNIKSNASEMSMTLDKQLARLKDQQLKVFTGITHKTLRSDVLASVPITRESNYSANVGIEGEIKDRTGALNRMTLTATHGLNIIDSSDKDDTNLSRDDAEPNFKKLELYVERQQYLSETTSLAIKINGQLGSHSLYSSEEFSFGGQLTGRAYDTSEFTAESGASAAIELYYHGFTQTPDLQFLPFVFYDTGYLYDNNQTYSQETIASSAGFGSRLYVLNNGFADITMAWPLLEDVSAPIYWGNRSPRLSFQLGVNF
jgi:hemolysin activation/secretion protein